MNSFEETLLSRLMQACIKRPHGHSIAKHIDETRELACSLRENEPALFNSVLGVQIERWLVGHDTFNVDLVSALEIDHVLFDATRLSHWGWPRPEPVRKTYSPNASDTVKLIRALEVCATSGGGLLQRINDNHALMEAVKTLPPDSVVCKRRSIEGLIKEQELFLMDINALYIHFEEQITVPWIANNIHGNAMRFKNVKSICNIIPNNYNDFIQSFLLTIVTIMLLIVIFGLVLFIFRVINK